MEFTSFKFIPSIIKISIISLPISGIAESLTFLNSKILFHELRINIQIIYSILIKKFKLLIQQRLVPWKASTVGWGCRFRELCPQLKRQSPTDWLSRDGRLPGHIHEAWQLPMCIVSSPTRL